ncbi:hypothetical protein HNQ02_003215 [Flavobacterium sp. 7E]|uniref:hypothetical protein n=1 Tax=Flavobacterium sp. 7E TaxID=2735898 RepID=UPI0020C5ECAE|nr:hypothetical protein [Flavobacterium sp. 7E]NRS90277.1 hypothetical protein [Flavobacterium sp. 7E]
MQLKAVISICKILDLFDAKWPVILKNFCLYIVLIVVFISCQRTETPIVSFYYWKTNFNLSPLELETIKENNVEKIYIRYFDLDLHPKTKQVYPVSPIHFTKLPNITSIVPVVYIQNKVMLDQNFNSQDLANKTNDFINLINTKNKLSCQEIQIDCDWTLSSKTNYLKFIEDFKRISAKKLSATIRLHQVKYFEKTKIPNVDSGVLMYYNMGTIAVKSLNSIYDQGIAKRYIKSLKKYPLPLSYALPIYSWGIHISQGKVIGLRSKLLASDLDSSANFTFIKKNIYRVNQSHYRKGVFYKKEDVIKIEAISADDLKEMASDLKENGASSPKEIIFYDLDELNLINYEKTIFKQVVTCF